MIKQVICEIFCPLSIAKGQCQCLASFQSTASSFSQKPAPPAHSLFNNRSRYTLLLRFLHTTNQALPLVQQNTETESTVLSTNTEQRMSVCQADGREWLNTFFRSSCLNEANALCMVFLGVFHCCSVWTLPWLVLPSRHPKLHRPSALRFCAVARTQSRSFVSSAPFRFPWR